MLTEDEVYQRLAEAVQRAGGVRAYARQLGVVPSYISDLIHKRRTLSDRILEELGLERHIVITYWEIGDAPDKQK